MDKQLPKRSPGKLAQDLWNLIRVCTILNSSAEYYDWIIFMRNIEILYQIFCSVCRIYDISYYFTLYGIIFIGHFMYKLLDTARLS